MQITGWTWYENPEYKDMTAPGGPFSFEDIREKVRDLIVQEIRKRGYKFTGDYHQNGDFGAPIIDDKWLYMTSQRSWGHMMVLAYPDKIDNSDGLGYCEWAWSAPEYMVLPTPEDYREAE